MMEVRALEVTEGPGAESEDDIPEAISTGDLEWLWDHRPDRISEFARHFSTAVLEDIDADDEESTRIGDSDVPDDDCGHLPEYRIDGECLRCEQAFNTADERAVKRELTADSGGLHT